MQIDNRPRHGSMRKNCCTMYKVIGYIKREGLSTAFLIPIYQLGANWFFHQLSANCQKIESFTPYIEEHYGADHTKHFVSLEGPEKTTKDAPFFVFMYENNVYVGDRANTTFVAQLKEIQPKLRNEFLRFEIEKILQ